MLCGTPRAKPLLALVLALIALGLVGCGEETREEAARPADQPAPGRVAVERAAATEGSPAADVSAARPQARLPRLVDLGRGTCVPCKMMTPILEELKREYEGRAVVDVIDLREDGRAGTDYGIRVIPTQIFFDSEGTEVWRHEGFLPRDQIVAKFAEMGVPSLDD